MHSDSKILKGLVRWADYRPEERFHCGSALAFAKLEYSQLVSVKGLCANMEGANLRGCNFEDPSGLRTNLEGVSLKGAYLESSTHCNCTKRIKKGKCLPDPTDIKRRNELIV
uniref:Pentapeptide repeat-containing protein n=1 Tax=Glossina palpalis gambiensis TaxID=67801 RepID=A0A1B0BKR4_9MUSC